MDSGASILKERDFIVLKFGGTSVSNRDRWNVIHEVVKTRCREGVLPVVVCSAASGVSNTLEVIVEKLKTRQPYHVELQHLTHTYVALAQELQVSPKAIIDLDLQKMEQILLGASLVNEVSPGVHAQIMAFGEILSTRLGAEFLTSQGLRVHWQDARDCLVSRDEKNTNLPSQFLAASCPTHLELELREKFLSIGDDVILTQGFIARNTAGQTVLLGRGGSDTSAAYFASKLGAKSCEIWTDVPGMYTANPREVIAARILHSLDYDEAQEMATMGAKILHPRCIAPLKQSKIPLHIRYTNDPTHSGTVISESASLGISRVKCISVKRNVTLVSIESLGMWQEVGFLADIFGVFKTHGLSIDLVSTAETNITVSIDSTQNKNELNEVDHLVVELSQFGKVSVIPSCATISLVGRNIRSIIHQLGPVLKVFELKKIYLVSQAASDLNLSFVVPEQVAGKLLQELHKLLFDNIGEDSVFGKSWQETVGQIGRNEADSQPRWWEEKSQKLIEIAMATSPAYVYDLSTIKKSATSLKRLTSVDRVFYAMKANDNSEVLQTIYASGVGFECVSLYELEYLFELFPNLSPDRVLFTPNFASRAEYEKAVGLKCHITLDNLYPLEAWPELFAHRNVLLRIDPGQGQGHHEHVQTAGERSKFGVSQNQISKAIELAQTNNTKIVGLHVHAGSGIHHVSHWANMAEFLLSVAPQFKDVEVLNLGGGLFVPAHNQDTALNLQMFDEVLAQTKGLSSKYKIWIEPGRFMVATAGVLLTRVTQLKEKGSMKFVGVDAGMNALIRPALYGAYHAIVNLTRKSNPIEMTAHVVGPICESGDTLGTDRKLPICFEGDVMLIDCTGAYGRVMSSRYNRRPFVDEYVFSV